MAIGINGSLMFSYEPFAPWNSQSWARQYPYYYSSIHSVNSPVVYTVRWDGGLDEGLEPVAANYVGNTLTGTGDVVNVLFDIYISNDRDAGLATFTTDWQLLTTVRKSRDIRNVEAGPPVTGGQGTSVAANHRFTIDISEVLKSELSYSLVPLGKGTWANWKWGGLNGGKIRQDNTSAPVWSNKWIQTPNGTYTWVRIRARTEIINADGIIQEATATGSYKNSYQPIILINNVGQWDSNKSDANASPATFAHSGWGTSATYARIMQSWQPNYTYNSSTTYGRKVMLKEMRLEEQTEVLQWYQNTINNISIYKSASNPETRADNPLNSSDLVELAYLEVTCYDKNWTLVSDALGNRIARLYDWNANLPPKTAIPVDAIGGGGAPTNITDAWARDTRRICTQNISIGFINANIIHPLAVTQAVWQEALNAKTWTRYSIDHMGGTRDQSSLFINDDVEYFKIGMVTETTNQGVGTGVVKSSMTEYRWYRVDRGRKINDKGTVERYGGIYYTDLRSDFGSNALKLRAKGFYWANAPKPFIRFHWLNSAGGIDSYTVKGYQTESYLMEKDTILRNQGNRWSGGWGKHPATAPLAGGGIPPYPHANAPSAGAALTPYTSDTMRGLDSHKGGREVLNVDADRVGTATTLPLYPQKARWLQEIATSPNVWIETDQMFTGPDGAYFNKILNMSLSDITRGANTDGRTPTNSIYTPVIITNSSVDTLDDEKGSTTITFEYTYAHPVITQGN